MAGRVAPPSQANTPSEQSADETHKQDGHYFVLIPTTLGDIGDCPMGTRVGCDESGEITPARSVALAAMESSSSYVASPNQSFLGLLFADLRLDGVLDEFAP